MASTTASPMRQALTSYGDKFGTFLVGTALHADHPAVKARPEAWAPLGLTDEELGQARLALHRAREKASPTPDPAPGRVQVLGPMPPERRRVALQAFAIPGVGMMAAGDVIDAEHPMVKKFPHLFAKESKP